VTICTDSTTLAFQRSPHQLVGAAGRRRPGCGSERYRFVLRASRYGQARCNRTGASEASCLDVAGRRAGAKSPLLDHDFLGATGISWLETALSRAPRKLPHRPDEIKRSSTRRPSLSVTARTTDGATIATPK